MSLMQVERQRAGNVNNEFAVYSDMKRIRQDTGALILFGGGKQFFLPAVHYFIRTGVVRILMFDNLVWHQVVL